MNMGLEGRHAIVCASSRGLGKACARALAAEGVAVVINGRDADRLAATAEEIRRDTGASVTPIVADLDTEAGRERLLAACPTPDILVNNNGGPSPGRFEDWDHTAWLAALESNLLAPVLLIRGVVAGMQARKFGRIVNAQTGAITLDAAYAEMAESIAARRLGTPEEFAAACVYLCSAQAGFVSGQNLQVDGGSYPGVL